MNLQYHLSIGEIMDFFSQEHEGFSEEALKEAEERIGAALPPVYCQFLIAFGADSVNDILHHINAPEDIYTTYQCIEEELEEWEPEFQEAVEAGTQEEYADNGYFDLWRLPKEEWHKVTDDYVLIWYENQGVWNAGYRLSDLLNKEPDPPVYMSTEDDFITFQKCADNTRTFLLHMLFEAFYEYEDASERYDDPTEIQEILKAAKIDPVELTAKGTLGVCLKPDEKELYLYLKKESYQELLLVQGEKLEE